MMTNTAQHTPGPWKRTHGIDIELSNGQGFSVDGTGNTSEESEANAQLITAAPDMYDALICPELEKAHDKLSELLEDEDAGNDEIRDAAIDICDVLNAFWLRRDAALAKAKSDEPTTKPTCAERAEWAESAVAAYARAKEGCAYDPIADMASDLFTDLCHLFLREGVSPEQMMERARTHYQEERAGEGREI